MAPNQLWKHKNQMIVLKAIAAIKEVNPILGFKVIFTGKELDERNGAYVQDLKQAVVDLGLQNEVKFLGFIDRQDQLLLMENAITIIQPSLFEGWSTVVEDAKSMNQFVILSDIPVHREQMQKNAIFFDPHDYKQLAHLMDKIVHEGINKEKLDYDSNILKFAEDFVSVFQ
jgi:glycosyltransferase involved in cell wall biosynthesis